MFLFEVLPFAPFRVELPFKVDLASFMAADLQLVTDMCGEINQHTRNKTGDKTTKQDHPLGLCKRPREEMNGGGCPVLNRENDSQRRYQK